MSFKLDLWNYQTWENLEPRQNQGRKLVSATPTPVKVLTTCTALTTQGGKTKRGKKQPRNFILSNIDSTLQVR